MNTLDRYLQNYIYDFMRRLPPSISRQMRLIADEIDEYNSQVDVEHYAKIQSLSKDLRATSDIIELRIFPELPPENEEWLSELFQQLNENDDFEYQLRDDDNVGRVEVLELIEQIQSPGYISQSIRRLQQKIVQYNGLNSVMFMEITDFKYSNLTLVYTVCLYYLTKETDFTQNTDTLTSRRMALHRQYDTFTNMLDVNVYQARLQHKFGNIFRFDKI